MPTNRFIFVTDSHMDEYNYSSVLGALLKCIDHAERLELPIIHGGDFFHHRKSLHPSEAWAFNEFMRYARERQVPMYMNIGNHDVLTTQNGFGWQELITDYKEDILFDSEVDRGFTTDRKSVSQYKIIINNNKKLCVALVRFLAKDILAWDDLYDDLLKIERLRVGYETVLVFHDDVHPWELGEKAEELIDSSLAAISGHLHGSLEAQGITYPGAFYQGSFGEAMTGHGYHIFSDSGYFKTIQTDLPRYITIDPPLDSVVSDQWSKDVIKLITDNPADQYRIISDEATFLEHADLIKKYNIKYVPLPIDSQDVILPKSDGPVNMKKQWNDYCKARALQESVKKVVDENINIALDRT